MSAREGRMRGRGRMLAAALVALLAGAGVVAAPEVATAAPTGFVDVAAGRSHSCAIAESSPGAGQGRVWCWGSNGSGQLGTHTTESVSPPVPVNLVDDAVQISAGARHTCAVRSDATVWCWGADNTGQLGDGSTEDSVTPVQVVGLQDVAEVSAGRAHTCARTHAGTAWCWGSGAYGALGDSSVVDSPFDLGAFQDNDNDLSISQDGERLYVSTSSHPAVHIVSTAGRFLGTVPTGFGVSPLGMPVTVAPAPDDSWFLARGSVLSRLDDTGVVLQAVFSVPCLTNVPCEIQGAAVDPGGTLYVTWVDSLNRGTLAAFPATGGGGVATTPLWSRSTGALLPTDLAVQMDARGVTRLYLRANSGVVATYSASGFALDTIEGVGVDSCGGGIDSGLLDLGIDPEGDLLLPSRSSDCVARFASDGTFLSAFGTTGKAPGQLDEPQDVVADPDGNVYVMDSLNNRLQKFDRVGSVDFNWGRRPFSSVPIEVDIAPIDDANGRISAGAHHTCASLGNQAPDAWGNPALALWCWGDNGADQLNLVAPTGPSTSIPGRTIWQWVDAVTGSDHTCARTQGGDVFCWGDNGSGQLGTGSPNAVGVYDVGVSDAVRLTAGGAFTCALVSSGTVRCWGSDSAGQLGDGPGADSCVPAAGGVVGDDPDCDLLQGVTAVAAGVAHACAITDSGAGIACWGRNDSHQVSPDVDADLTHAVPVAFPDIAASVQVSVTLAAPDTVDTGLSVAGALSVAFSAEVSSVSGSGVTLTGWDGTPVAMDMLCRNSVAEPVDCMAGPVLAAELRPHDLLTPGDSYTVTVNPPGAQEPVAVAGDPVPTFVSDAFQVDPRIPETSPVVVQSWRRGRSVDALGGTFVAETTRGATVSYPFTGTDITWVSARGPGEGRASVTVDGVTVGTFDNHAARLRFGVRHAVHGLADGPHVLTLKVEPRTTGTPKTGRVVVDGFLVRHDAVVTTDATPSTLVAGWATRALRSADGGRYAVSEGKGAAVQVRFVGTQLTWHTFLGATQGDARVVVDGAVWRTIHSYRSGALVPADVTMDGLDPGAHTIRIVVLGTGPGGRDAVAVDGFVAG